MYPPEHLVSMGFGVEVGVGRSKYLPFHRQTTAVFVTAPIKKSQLSFVLFVLETEWEDSGGGGGGAWGIYFNDASSGFIYWILAWTLTLFQPCT